MLRLENIVKNYQTGKTSFPALKGISLAFRKNEFVSILGPSGCGKTTLLNIIGGLDHYTTGDLVIEGKSTKEYKSRDWDLYRNHRIGFIFQSYNLIPHQNILENVELALTIAGYSKEERRKKALRALSKVGLKKAWKKMPNQLSGGQCQRVAIARALVNEPDILLGDEPTGALDSKTSVQVMELIKKISKKKLVIMVTHNPPLAEQYSTRIISLLDGKVIKDTRPYKLNEEKNEKFKRVETIKVGNKTAVKADKAKMSFWQAFKLSAKNLVSKKKRTAMVIVASSIGIVGVSAVLAVSTGVKGFISNTEKDMLSGNPLYAGETSLDLVSILQNVSSAIQRQAVSESIKQKGCIDIEFITGILIQQAKEGILISNDLDANYEKYIRYGTELGEKKTGIIDSYFNYGYSVANNLYTNAEIYECNTEPTINKNYVYSLTSLKNIYTALLDTIETPEGTDFTALANVAANFPSVVYQGLDNVDYLKQQYDLVDVPGYTSKWPTNYTSIKDQDDPEKDFECVVVLNRRKKLEDLIVTLSGLLSEKNFMKCIFEFIKDKPDQEVIKKLQEIAIQEIMGKVFYYVPNGKTGIEGAYKANSSVVSEKTVYDELTPFDYNHRFLKDGNNLKIVEKDVTERSPVVIADPTETAKTVAKRVKVVGIITPKEGRNYGSLSSGIYFQSDLANKMMRDTGNTDDLSDTTKAANNSEIYNVMINKDYWSGSSTPIYCLNYGTFNNAVRINPDDLSAITMGLTYPMNFGRIKEFNGDDPVITELKTYGTVGSSARIIQHFKEGTSQLEYLEISSKQDLRSAAGRKIKYASNGLQFKKLPYSIGVYSSDFETKNMAKAYLEKWNSNERVQIGPNEWLEAKDRTRVIVPDNLTIVITMINGLITTTTVSLTIFASLSLVVSSVMIGIITYISVMERIKEIGVIRSLGGRKKDVSHLFNAETFILGTAAGIFGVIITYIFELILDIAIYAAYKIPMIANLKWWTALIMIVLSIVLTAVSGLIPSRSAAKKDPVTALRSE